MTPWTPRFGEGSEPLYERLFVALKQDVASGALAAGARLPPHRELAFRLGIGVGTVTKAYALAEADGIVQAQVGRGSFVRGLPRRDQEPPIGPIDLSRNLAPTGPAAARLDQGLARLRRLPDIADQLGYAPPLGREPDRRAAAAWLQRSAGFAADWRRLACCGGAQQAMTLAFGALCRPGDTIIAEAATFLGMKSLAAQAGYRLVGAAMDAEGLRPDALDEAAAAGAKVAYVLPTLQNPTARVMGARRRDEIVRVARQRDLWIVEDDVYAPYARALDLAPLATLAPERTVYISSASKILGAGLRAGFLVCPEQLLDKVVAAVRAFTYAPGGLGGLLVRQWIEDGSADEIGRAVHAEIEARNRLAEDLLPGRIETSPSTASLHIWLPMSEIAAERAAMRALRAGVETTPPAAPLLEGSELSGLRICLGAPEERAVLERALGVLASALSTDVSPGERALI